MNENRAFIANTCCLTQKHGIKKAQFQHNIALGTAVCGLLVGSATLAHAPTAKTMYVAAVTQLNFNIRIPRLQTFPRILM